MSWLGDLLKEIGKGLEKVAKEVVVKRILSYVYRGKTVQAEVPSDVAEAYEALNAKIISLDSKLDSMRVERDNYKKGLERFYRFAQEKGILQEMMEWKE